MISLITSAVNLSAITFHHHNANHNYSNTVNLQYPISTHNRYSQHLYYDDDTPNLHIGADISNVLNNDTSYIDLSSAISNFNGTYSSNETNFEDYTQIPYYIRATSMVFCIIIMCMGVIGNVMVPIVILKTKDMRNSTNIFLVNLSIADLMVLLVCTPTVLVEVNTKPETWVLGKELCLAVPFIELTVAHASVLTILAISFERYYAICEPLRAGYVCTKTRATLICALAWFVAAVFTSPILAIADHRKEKYQDGSAVFVCLTQATQFWPTMFFIMTISIFFFTPFVVLIILYTIIAKNLITASSKVVMNKHVDCLNSRARKQVILMLGTVVLCFFICLLPFRILMLYIIIVPDSVLANLGVERYYNILFFCRTMLYLNSAINPILYNLMSSKFRKGFFRIFCCAENPSEIRNYRRGYRMRTGTFNTTSSSYTTSSSVSRNTNSLKNAISKKISNADQSGTKIDDVSTNFSANRDGGLAREAHIASSQKRKELCKQNSDPHPTAIEPCAYENKYTNSTIYKVLKKSKFLRQRSDPINSHSESVENIISTSINKIMSVGNVCDEESAGSFDVSFKINNDTLKKSKVDHIDARFIADHRPVGRQRSLDVQNFRTNSLRRNVMLNSVKTKSFDSPDVEESLTLGEIVGPKSACVFKQSRCLNRAYPESYV